MWKGQEHPRWEPCACCGSRGARVQDVRAWLIAPSTSVACMACGRHYSKARPPKLADIPPGVLQARKMAGEQWKRALKAEVDAWGRPGPPLSPEEMNRRRRDRNQSVTRAFLREARSIAGRMIGEQWKRAVEAEARADVKTLVIKCE